MGDLLITCGKVLLSLYVLRLGVERGEVISGWVFEHIWRSIEAAFPGGGRTARLIGGHVVADAKAKVRYAIWTVAEPFVEIARSFIPRFEIVGEPAVPEKPLGERSAPPEQVVEEVVQTPLEPPVDNRPSEADYRAAMDRFGLSPSCPEVTAAKTWVKLRAGNEQAIDADWKVICAYRGFRRN